MTYNRPGAQDPNKPITIYAEEGSGTIGILKNNVLHMERVYETHHFRKQPGWGIDKKAMDNNIHRIRAIVIHCKRMVDGLPKEQLLTYTIDFEKDLYGRGSKELIFNTIDFAGHGQQYLIPDSRWKLEMQTSLPSNNEIKLPQPEAPKLQTTVPPINIPQSQEGINIFDMPSQKTIRPSLSPLFTFVEVYPFLKKGYRFYENSLGEGFYIEYEGNILKVKHEVLDFDMPYVFDANRLDALKYSLKL